VPQKSDTHSFANRPARLAERQTSSSTTSG
jgi:hypothetical protein